MDAISGVILHVDDDQSVRESLAVLLQSDGYVVSSAASGTEAIQLASDGLRPDVLIMDFDLGQRMNGAEAAEQIHDLLRLLPAHHDAERRPDPREISAHHRRNSVAGLQTLQTVAAAKRVTKPCIPIARDARAATGSAFTRVKCRSLAWFADDECRLACFGRVHHGSARGTPANTICSTPASPAA